MDGGDFYKNATKKVKDKKFNMIVIRINNKGELKNARPCHNCLIMMKNIKINKVYYSVDNNIICEKVKNMISIQSSSVRINLDCKTNKITNVKY